MIRDYKGSYLVGFSKGLGIATNNFAEALAVWIGVRLLKERVYSKIIVEGDLKLIIDYFNSKANIPWEIKDMLEDCKSILQEIQNVKICHSLREGNSVADAMANLGVNEENLIIWDFNHFPNQINEIIAKDRLRAIYSNKG